MSYKLLIIDDNRGCSDLYKLRFECDKWEVKVAYSAEQAIEMIKTNYRPDAILLDIMLPKMQGGEMLKILKNDKSTKDIVVVVLTALSLNPQDQELISGLADDYILKIEVMPKQLVERVTKLVEAKKVKIDKVTDNI